MKENQQIEWKTAWRDDYLRWICGFANAEGGRLVIGRDDRGVAVGIEDAERLMEEIPNKVRDLLGILVAIQLRREKGKELIEIRVEPHPNPISYKGEYYLRSGSTNQMLKGAALDRFLLRKHGRTWDVVPLPGVKPTDLDLAALKTFRQLAQKSQRLPDSILDEPDKALLEKLHLVEGTYLTRAAILLFHPDPQRFFPNATIKIGYFEAGTGLRYQDEIEGNLIAQINQALEVLKAKYLRAWISYAGLQRLETWPVPLAALREALLNAVVHRDYALSGPIQISVYPDKLMIWNPGELPPSWTVRNLLRKHASVPFNPAIARTFFRAGLIEAWGQGIERIRDAAREAGIPEPELNAEPTGLWVEFRYLPEHVAATGETTETTPVEAQTPVETPVKPSGEGRAPVKTPVEISEEGWTPVETPVKTPAAILALLRENPRLTLAEVAEKLGRSLRAVERAASKLATQGTLRYIGSKRSGHWEVAPVAPEPRPPAPSPSGEDETPHEKKP